VKADDVFLAKKGKKSMPRNYKKAKSEDTNIIWV
jgi:hypothetical protein